MKLEIINSAEYGVEQAALGAALLFNCPTNGFIRKGYLTMQGPCEKVKYLGVKELETDRIRDCVQSCIDECNGVLLFKSGDYSSLEQNIVSLVGESKPMMEIDFLNPVNVRRVTTWALAEGITKLYVTGRNDSKGLNIFYNKTLEFMKKFIKDLTEEFDRIELDNLRKGKTTTMKG